MLFATVLLAVAPVRATLIDGTEIKITGSMSGGPAETIYVQADQSGLVVTSGFSWMIAGDFIDVRPRSTSPDVFDRFKIFFSQNHSIVSGTPTAPIFADGTYFDFTFTLPETWTFGVGAITAAISAQVSAAIDDNVMSVHIYALDQMTGGSKAFDGYATVLAASYYVPEATSTAWLAALGITAACFGRQRLRRRA